MAGEASELPKIKLDAATEKAAVLVKPRETQVGTEEKNIIDRIDHNRDPEDILRDLAKKSSIENRKRAHSPRQIRGGEVEDALLKAWGPEPLSLTPEQRKVELDKIQTRIDELSGSGPSSKDKPREKILSAGNKTIKQGDSVIVTRSNGALERDWTLKSFGTGLAVVEKTDPQTGELLRKYIPIEQFKYQQEVGIPPEPYHGNPDSYARRLTTEDRLKMASDFGIDMKGKSQEQILDDLDQVIRRMSGE